MAQYKSYSPRLHISRPFITDLEDNACSRKTNDYNCSIFPSFIDVRVCNTQSLSPFHRLQNCNAYTVGAQRKETHIYLSCSLFLPLKTDLITLHPTVQIRQNSFILHRLLKSFKIKTLELALKMCAIIWAKYDYIPY
jgi:hypothetical protein